MGKLNFYGIFVLYFISSSSLFLKADSLVTWVIHCHLVTVYQASVFCITFWLSHLVSYSPLENLIQCTLALSFSPQNIKQASPIHFHSFCMAKPVQSASAYYFTDAFNPNFP